MSKGLSASVLEECRQQAPVHACCSACSAVPQLLCKVPTALDPSIAQQDLGCGHSLVRKRTHLLQECMTLWACHSVQAAKHVSKCKDVRCIRVSTIGLQDAIRPPGQLKFGFAGLSTQLQVQQEVAMLQAALYIAPAQVFVCIASLQKW